MDNKLDVRYGDIVFIKLDKGVGSEQNGSRPAIIIQNDVGNIHSPTTIVMLLTSKILTKAKLPTHVILDNSKSGLEDSNYKLSLALAEHLRTIDKKRIIKKIGNVNEKDMELIKNALRISLNL